MRSKFLLIVSITIIGAAVISQCSIFSQARSFREDTGYTGSEQCCSCHGSLHPEIIRQWKASSHHLTMKSGSWEKDIPANLKLIPSLEKEDILAVIGYEDGGYLFVGLDFQVFPPEGFRLEGSFPPHDEIGLEGKKLDAGQSCFGCHATGYFVSRKKYVEPGVACEACHGPGRKHVDSGGAEGTIVNPARLPPDRNRMVCGQCHSIGKDPSGVHPFPVINRGEPYRPGHDLTLGFVDSRPVTTPKGGEYSTFVLSPEPYSNQLCTDCHDPHGKTGNPSMLGDPTSALCKRCHWNPLSGIAQVDEERHWGAHKYPCWYCHEYTHIH